MRSAVIVALLLSSAGAHAEGIEGLLAKGPMVSIETDREGRFAKATAVIRIERPLEAVWVVACDFANYRHFIPKVVESETRAVEPTKAVREAGQTQVDLTLELEVPGANPGYTFRYTIDPKKRELHGQWLEGDLKGSFSHWRLVADGPHRTLLYYSTASRNFSSFAQALEDDQQTITVGVNVSAALATVNAVKRRAEREVE